MRETIVAGEQELYIQAAARISQAVQATLQHRGSCILAIMGGRSLPQLLECLLPHGISWKGRIEVFWIDERIGPEKNFSAALHYLEHLHRSGVQIAWHPFQSLQLQQAELELREIETALQIAAGAPRFDVVVASAGEDGHIASLFPHHDLLNLEHAGYAFEQRAPKPPALRVSATPALLRSAQYAVLLFVHKEHAYRQFSDPASSSLDCPAKLLEQVPVLSVFVAR